MAKLLISGLLAVVLHGATCLQLQPPLAMESQFTQEKYEKVASFKKDGLMEEFARALLMTEGYIVTDEDALESFIPNYSGTVAVQDVQRMRDELLNAPWVREVGIGEQVDLSPDGLGAIGEEKDPEKRRNHLGAFVKRMFHISPRADSKFKELLTRFSEQLEQPYDDSNESFALTVNAWRDALNASGLLVANDEFQLTQVGWNQISSSQEDQRRFVMALLEREGRSVKDYDAFTAALPTLPSNFEDMQKVLRTAAWVDWGLGRHVPLTEEGYDLVAQSMDPSQVRSFARRLLTASHRPAADASLLDDVAMNHYRTLDFSDFKAVLFAEQSEP